MKLFILTLGLAVLTGTTATAKQEFLPANQVDAWKQKDCAFLHVWATWCTICLEEMPGVIKMLSAARGVTPVVIDVSAKYVQDNFSKKWMKTLSPPFTTFLKPAVKDDVYMEKIDAKWGGTLPFSALYSRGRKLKEWVGALDLNSVPAELGKLCSKN